MKRYEAEPATVKTDTTEPDAIKRDTSSMTRQDLSRAGDGNGPSFIPDDVNLGSGELPPDFWGEPVEGEHGESSHEIAHEKPDDSDTSTDPSVPATTLSAAFDEMQSLFPGRVLEVTNLVEDPAAAVDDQSSPLDDEILGHDGYDDDDQDRLSFGPSRDV